MDLSKAAEELRARLGAEPCEVTLVLGSGLGGLVAAVEEPTVVPFADLGGMPPVGVSGHSGRWIGGRLERLLRTIIEKFGGGPVGLNSIAAAIGEEKEAIEDIYEPFLIQAGFLDRTQRGRMATPRAYDYFGLTVPDRERRLW